MPKHNPKPLFYSIRQISVLCALRTLRGGAYERRKEGMRLVGTGSELGMILHAHKKFQAREAHRLHQSPVRGDPFYLHPSLFEDGTEIVVELITVAVSFSYGLGMIYLSQNAVLFQHAFVRA